MKPPGFRYAATDSVSEALRLLADNGPDSKLLAGGQSIIQLLNLRVAYPRMLIDINGIDSLAYVRPHNGTLAIGALTRVSTLERDETVTTRMPLLAEASGWVAYPAIRNRSTLGGLLAYADPLAELPAVMVALDAEIEVAKEADRRSVPAREFFTGPYETVLEPDEMITEIRVPVLPDRTGTAFLEFARREREYALAGVAASVSLADDGTISDARIGLCSVGPSPVRASAAEEMLRGQRPDRELWNSAAAAGRDALTDVPSDFHGSADYRRHLAGVLIERALATAAARAEGAK
jgi:aerobic carbon-monoxide dehydrogenase medium subunit